MVLLTSKIQQNTKNGFSLLELVLAIAIFGLGSFATSYLIIDANSTATTAFKRADAIALARDSMEILSGIRNVISDFNNFKCPNTQPCGLDSSNYNWVMSSTPDTSGGFTRSVYIDNNFNASATTTSTASTTVVVSWTGIKGNIESVSLHGIFYNWRYLHPVVTEE